MPCTKNMRGCRSTCGHRALVEAFRESRITWEQLLEDTACGWETEEAEFREQNPPPTFRQFLEQNGRAS